MRMEFGVAAYATTSLTASLLPLIGHPVPNEYTFVPPLFLGYDVSNIALMIAFSRENITAASTSARATRMVTSNANVESRLRLTQR
jgi:hypothetical protein